MGINAVSVSAGQSRLEQLAALAATAIELPLEHLEATPRAESNENLVFVPVGIYGNGAATGGQLNGVSLAQIDDGAAISLISREVVQQMGLVSYRDVVRATAAFDKSGTKTDITEFQDVVPMWVVLTGHNGKGFVRIPISIRAHVVSHSDFDILIGASDLAQYRLKVDLYDQAVEFYPRRTSNAPIRVDGVPRSTLQLPRARDLIKRVMKVQLAEALRSDSQKAERLKIEQQDLTAYASQCSDGPMWESQRPALFPPEYWRCLPDRQKPLVMERYLGFTETRLTEIIPKIAGIDISQEDPQRAAEEPYVRALFYAYPNVFFAKDEADIQPIKDAEFSLMVTDESPIANRNKVRGYTLEERAFLSAKTRKMVKQHRLLRQAGPHESGVVLVPYPDRINAFKQKYGDDAATFMNDPKYDDEVSTWFRLTVDYRELNKRLVMHKFPLPRIQDLINKSGCEASARYTTGDIEDAFFTIYLKDPKSRELTGFSTHEDHYVFTCMPQGVATAAEVWAEVVSQTFTDLLILEMFFYQDDIFVYANGLTAHLSLYEQIFDRMIARGMVYKPSKYHANYRMMKCLGHVLTEDGRYPDPELVRAITDLGIPQDQSAVRSLVALAIVAKEYVHSMSEVIAPLQDLMKKDVDVVAAWKTDVHGRALRDLKRILTSSPVLMGIDLKKEFRIHVDACKQGRGIGAVLLQKDDEGRWRPVAYWSHKLTDTERGYSATDLECKGLHDAIIHWSTYLRTGRHFEVVTDHYALVYMVTRPPRENNGRILRYTTDLLGYRFSVLHRKGGDHLDADAVSRLLRHDEYPVKIYTADELVERGVVTTKDVADLKEWRDVTLPRPGIDRPTIEQQLELDRIDENIQAAGDERKRNNQALIQRIELRHKAEQLAGTMDDPDGFDDYYLRMPDGTDVKEGSALVVRALSLTTEPSQSSVSPAFELQSAQLPVRCHTRFSTVCEWKKFYQQDSAMMIRTVAGEQSRLNDALIVHKLGVERRQLRRSTDLKLGRRAHNKEMARAVIARIKRPLLDDSTDKDSACIELAQAMVKMGIDDGNKLEIVRRFPADLQRPLRQALQVDEAVVTEDGIAMTDEVATALQKYQWLIGAQFIDDENRRPYRVVNIEWHEDAKCAVARRVATDGAPPDEMDGDTFLIEGGDNSVLALVEQYRQRHPDDLTVTWLSEDTIIELQQRDEACSRIIQKLQMKNGSTEADGSISLRRGELTFLWRPGPQSILRVKTQRTQAFGDITILRAVDCIVVPMVAVDALLSRYHDGYGHPAHDRMYRTLMMKYYWDSMYRDVGVFADTCLHCQMRKRVHSKRAPLLSFPRCDRPFQRCHIDLSGPFVTSKRGMKYILIFKDALTKWVEIFALPSKTADAVAECLVDEILMRHGAPSLLMSDQGTEFVNSVVDQVSLLLRIRRVTTSPYHPRADGLAENQVGTIKDMLSAYVNVFQDDWDDYLAVIAHYYRTTVNAATGFTPYRMLYGRECQQPDELWIRAFNEESKEGETTVTDYVRGLAESMLLVWELVSEQSYNQATVRNDRNNRLLKHIPVFKPGQSVWLQQPPATTFISQDDNEKHQVKKSLRNRYTGPYTVLRKLSPITYIIRVGDEEQHHTIDRMKPFHQRTRKQDRTEVADEDKAGHSDAEDAEVTLPVKRRRGRPRKELRDSAPVKPPRVRKDPLSKVVRNIANLMKDKETEE